SLDGGTLSYQWQRKLSGAYSSWEDINYDINSNFYTYNNVPSIVNGSKYRVIVRNYINGTYTQTISDSAVLNVQKDNSLDITAGVVGGVAIGGALAIGAAAAGVFAWGYSVTGGYVATGTLLASGTFATYFGAITAGILLTGGVIVGTGVGVAYGTNAKDPVTNYDSPLIYIHPQDFIAKQGTPALFFVKALVADNGVLTYQWESSNNGGGSYNTIIGARDSVYATGNVNSSDNNKLFRVKVTSTHGNSSVSRYSNAARIIYDNSNNPIIETIVSIGGTITRTQTVNLNSNFTVTFSPLDGFEIDKIVVDQTTLNVNPANNQYVFSNITASHIIIVTFKLKTVSLVINVIDNLGFSNIANVQVPFGADYRVLFSSLLNTRYDLSGYSLNSAPLRNDSLVGYTIRNMRTHQQLNLYLRAKTKVVKIYLALPNLPDTLTNTFNVIYGDNVPVIYGFNKSLFAVDSIFVDNVYSRDSIN
ncbi:MAG: hypothetical protein ORN58_05140, partial [Sediminibacterium sp.]|nr:hypothetical protein [Sediminibacterium sp.]